jgi:hypothetical protein
MTPNRCRARNCSHGFFFDPVTFDATSRTAEAVFADPESPEKGDVEGVDEVSSGSCLYDTA